MPPQPGLSRLLTFAAAVVLGFDGTVLAGLGAWTHRPLVTAIGVVLFVAAVMVLVSWRGQARRLHEIAAARRELREEARALDDYLRRN